jgi:hypothetical protein
MITEGSPDSGGIIVTLSGVLLSEAEGLRREARTRPRWCREASAHPSTSRGRLPRSAQAAP